MAYRPISTACYDFIQALDKCHQKAYYKRILGICNNEKEALSQCLKQASMENKKKAIIESKSKRSVIEEKWKKIDEEEYGEDKVLEILMNRMREKKENAAAAAALAASGAAATSSEPKQ